MGYLIKAAVGLGLFFGGVVLFNVKLQELLDIGTCASGNVPFEISQPCPEGTGTSILVMGAGILTGLAGAAIFAFRGDPTWGRRERPHGFFGLGTLAWGSFFAGTGAALLLGGPYGEAVDPSTGEVVGRPDSQLGATITGVTFLLMGVPALLLGSWNWIRGLGGRRERAAITGMAAGGAALSSLGTGPLGGSHGGDVIGSLERLQRLRESGAISEAEFERAKAKVLAQ